MGEPALATLRVGEVPVATYVEGSTLNPTLSPRPYLHPVRTLAGTPVTDAQPADHPWHLGISVAIQDVDGWNFWGGPTYVRGQDYVWRDDHGRVDHDDFPRAETTGFDERLRWVTPPGELVLTEHRHVRARPADEGWELELATKLTNATGREVLVGSPATNGRKGTGYGGLFWRLPRSQGPRVRTQDAAGEVDVHGSRSPWLSWTDPAAGFTLVFTRLQRDPADPWFVRVAEYPGMGMQLAARDPLALSIGGSVTRGWRVLLADGVLGDGAVVHWVEKSVKGEAWHHTADRRG